MRTDENLRVRFALDRIETVAELCLRGFDLSREDIDLFWRTDARLWFLSDIASGERPHSGRPDDVRLPRWPTRDHTRTRGPELTEWSQRVARTALVYDDALQY